MQANSRVNLPCAQRARLALHHKIRMRKVFIPATVAALALLLVCYSGLGTTLAGRMVFYGRVARLYTKTPDATLSMPLKDVTKKQIADTWHAPRGTDRLHEGQDIFAPKGTAIYSATPGYVYNIGENHLGGQTVSVIGAGGRVYYYAHLNSYAPGLEVGERVTKQTVLGFVGTTGNAQGTPPHLHFGVYTAAGAINPLPLLSDRTTSTASKKKGAGAKRKKLIANHRV
jgi:peptidoglycan LD-endopeptidase LytH